MKLYLLTVLIKYVRHYTKSIPSLFFVTPILTFKIYYLQSEDIMRIFKTLNLVLQLHR